ncbi:TEA/ATTS domain family-domain-containing protein [Helicostylum pulchrum]|nr:TEA/ATTS domain family-domain-containing protein [Helicostylum pulchrum]
MLACPQDIFFHNDTNNTLTNGMNKYQNLIHESNNNSIMQNSTTSEYQHKDKRIRHEHLRKDQVMSNNDIEMSGATNGDDLLDTSAIANNNIKDKEEQVWPPDVESAFIEALESIPKLGRRKILVNGKPCGRNELISDFIFRKTCKIRTRKQVSSHIQVLKNTRKGDSHFMRLLTDSVELDENNHNINRNNSNNSLKPKIRQPHHSHNQHQQVMKNNNPIKMKSYQPNDSLSSDDSSINSSPSPTDYVFDIMCSDPAQQQALSMLQFKDFYDPFQQSLFFGMVTEANNTNATTPSNANFDNLADPFFGGSGVLYDQQQGEGLEESLMHSLSSAANTPIASAVMKKKMVAAAARKGTAKKRKSQHDETTNDTVMNVTSSIAGSEYSLWPNYVCLYLEYASPYEPSRPLSHNLSQLPHCYPNGLPVVSVNSVSKEKCPPIATLSSSDSVLLLAKTKLDLNLNISEFAFNNTSFFETQTRRTIECTTTIYSFGNVVLESKEVQQALWVNEGKYMYSFVFVNQFFDAFMKGIRSLQSWDEVDIAINNLCIVQSFEDIESKYTNTGSNTTESVLENTNSPLLVMVYEFERGNGTIDISAIVQDKVDIAKSLEFFDQDI